MSFFDDASLVQIPSGISDGTLYSVKPIDGSGDLTFSRGSDIEATRVNSQGYIEKAKVNLLTYSNTFSNAVWINDNSTETSGQAGYDGTNNAWLLTSTSAGGFIYQNVTISGLNTFSVYAKAGSQIGVTIYSAHVSQGRYFNLSTGALGGTFVGTPIASSIDEIGGGWYRCSITVSATATNNFRVYVSNGTANVAGNIYIQDAQLNYGLVAQDYVETTTAAVVSGITNDMPRLNYNPANPTCPSLLLEPQRTNLITYSELFANWIPENTNVTANATISPDGYSNADAIIENTSGGDHNRALGITLTAASYTGSVFLKKYNTSWCAVYIYNPSGGKGIRHWINLDTLTAGTSAAIGSGITAPLTLTNYGNGWVRASMTFTADASGWYLYVANAQTNGGSASYTGNGTSGFYAWGGQLEQGTYATSYIPTYGSSATRSADGGAILQNMRTNGITTTGAFTAFFDISPEQLDAASGDNSVFFNTWVNNLSSGIVSARKYYVSNPEGNIRWFSDADGVTMGYSDTTNKKWAVVCNGTSVKVFTDGALVVNYTGTNSHNSLGSMQLGYGSSNRTSTSFSQCLVFPTALSDADCITLTA